MPNKTPTIKTNITAKKVGKNNGGKELLPKDKEKSKIRESKEARRQKLLSQLRLHISRANKVSEQLLELDN